MKDLNIKIEGFKVRRAELASELISDEEVYDCGNQCRNIQKKIDGVTKQVEYFRGLMGNDRGTIYTESNKAIDSLSAIQGVFDARWVQYNRRARFQMDLRKQINALDKEIELLDAIPGKVADLMVMAYAQPSRFEDCILKVLMVNYDLYNKVKGQ